MNKIYCDICGKELKEYLYFDFKDGTFEHCCINSACLDILVKKVFLNEMEELREWVKKPEDSFEFIFPEIIYQK